MNNTLDTRRVIDEDDLLPGALPPYQKGETGVSVITGNELGVTSAIKQSEKTAELTPEQRNKINFEENQAIPIHLQPNHKELSSKGGKAKRRRRITLTDRDYETLHFLSVVTVATNSILTLAVKHSFSDQSLQQMTDEDRERFKKRTGIFKSVEGNPLPSISTIQGRLKRLQKSGYVQCKEIYGAKPVWAVTEKGLSEVEQKGLVFAGQYRAIDLERKSESSIPHLLGIAHTVGLLLRYGTKPVLPFLENREVTLDNIVTEGEIEGSWARYLQLNEIKRNQAEQQLALVNGRRNIKQWDRTLEPWLLKLPDLTNVQREHPDAEFTIKTTFPHKRNQQNYGRWEKVPDLVVNFGTENYAIEVELNRKPRAEYQTFLTKYLDDRKRDFYTTKQNVNGRIVETDYATKQPGLFRVVTWLVLQPELESEIRDISKGKDGKSRWAVLGIKDRHLKPFTGRIALL